MCARGALPPCDHVHDQSGQEEACSRHEQRRDGVDRETDSEIRRAPNNVERGESREQRDFFGGTATGYRVIAAMFAPIFRLRPSRWRCDQLLVIPSRATTRDRTSDSKTQQSTPNKIPIYTWLLTRKSVPLVFFSPASSGSERVVSRLRWRGPFAWGSWGLSAGGVGTGN